MNTRPDLAVKCPKCKQWIPLVVSNLGSALLVRCDDCKQEIHLTIAVGWWVNEFKEG